MPALQWLLGLCETFPAVHLNSPTLDLSEAVTACQVAAAEGPVSGVDCLAMASKDTQSCGWQGHVDGLDREAFVAVHDIVFFSIKHVFFFPVDIRAAIEAKASASARYQPLTSLGLGSSLWALGPLPDCLGFGEEAQKARSPRCSPKYSEKLG